MEDILDRLVDSRIKTLLETININYPDKIKKSDIEKEIIYIKERVNWKKIKSIKSLESKKPLYPKKSLEPKNKEVNKELNKANQCSGRIWTNYIVYKKNNKKVDNIIDKFKVDDFNDLDEKDFNSKYIIGLRCSKTKYDDSKYCKLHTKHLIHGDYSESPNKELCYHFMKNGKYL